MASASERMQLLLDMAARDQASAAEVLRKAQAHYQLQARRLDEILEQLASYESLPQQAVTPGQLIQRRAFVQQLGNLQTQQRQQLALALRELEAQKDAWQKTHLKHRALQEWVARCLLESDKAMGLAEQKMLDDWATQQAARKKPDGPSLH
jgi:flagellar export protein FliJ